MRGGRKGGRDPHNSRKWEEGRRQGADREGCVRDLPGLHNIADRAGIAVLHGDPEVVLATVAPEVAHNVRRVALAQNRDLTLQWRHVTVGGKDLDRHIPPRPAKRYQHKLGTTHNGSSRRGKAPDLNGAIDRAKRALPELLLRSQP